MGNIIHKTSFLFLDNNPRTLTTETDTYTFGGILGSGGTADVYSSRAKSDDMEYAIKEIPKHSKYGLPPITRCAVMGEVLILQRLSHANIVKYHDFGEDNQSMYIITELYVKGDLLSYMDNTAECLSEERAIIIMLQVFNALFHMHTLGISHGDIKPENILLDENGSVHLADLGLANFRIAGREWISQEPVGTPQYIPPEVKRGENYSPVGVDLWSCGVTLYVLIMGSFPFQDCEGYSIPFNTQDDVTKVIENSLTILQLSCGVRHLLRQLLQIDPDARIGPGPASVECLQFLGNHQKK